MSFSAKTRYLFVFLAIVTGSLIELFRGYRSLIVVVGFFTFLGVGFLLVYLSGTKERALRRRQKRDFYAGALLLVAFAAIPARAQLLGEPPLPDKKEKKQKQRGADLEWMWQYSPPPADGRERELLEDPNFRPFLDKYFTAPQSFWGPKPTDPKAPVHKSLADTVYDFLAVPGKVIADENRYITVTGAVFHFRTSRGLVFADLNTAQPLVVFAAIDWIRDSKTVDDPAAEYTLWLFPDQPTGPTSNPTSLPPALLRSLTRWMLQPVPGTGFPQKITHAILVDRDGTPHEIPVPAAAVTEEGPQLPKRSHP